MSSSSKFIIGIIIAIVIIWAGYALMNSENSRADTIKIGVVAPLTGDAANMGENKRIALEIARDEINASGGINGSIIELIVEDGKCDGKEATNAANKLLNIDKVKAIIGGMCSAETLAIAPLAEAAKIPLISSASTNPKVTDAGDYVFRFIASDSFQGKFAAEHVFSTLNKKNVAIIYCLSDWCVGIKDVFKTRFAELGGKIAIEEGYAQEAGDLRTQITKVKASNPELIYFLGYTQGSIIGLKQMKELGVKVPVFGGDAWDDPKIAEDSGASGEGATYSIAANQSLPETFVSEMNKRTGTSEVLTYSPRAYDILKSLASAMMRVGTDGEKIKNELYIIKDYQGIADKYSIDSNGDVIGAKYDIKKFSKGKLELVQ